MKAWNKFAILISIGLFAILICINFAFFQLRDEGIAKNYIVDIHRIQAALLQGKRIEDIETSNIRVETISQEELSLLDYINEKDEQIIILPSEQAGIFYQFAYKIDRIPNAFVGSINIIFIFILLLLLGIFLYIKYNIIFPFHAMEVMANELTHRNFEYQLPQQKDKFFGKFIWAIDVLKEELKYYEQKELELMKEKKVLIASLSHDIKTPLANIRLYNNALTKDIYSKELIVQRIDENCEKIDQYLKEIIKSNQDDLFNFDITLQEVYMHDVMQILIQEKERVELAMIQYSLDCCENSIVRVDLYRLKEVIHNIIDNAVKYGDGKWIHISFYQEDYHQIIKITNSGTCIDDKNKNSIFQSFYRGDTNGKQQGSGLGLYICKQLMKQMDGDVFLSQEKEEVSFHIVLG